MYSYHLKEDFGYSALFSSPKASTCFRVFFSVTLNLFQSLCLNNKVLPENILPFNRSFEGNVFPRFRDPELIHFRVTRQLVTLNLFQSLCLNHEVFSEKTFYLSIGVSREMSSLDLEALSNDISG